MNAYVEIGPLPWEPGDEGEIVGPQETGLTVFQEGKSFSWERWVWLPSWRYLDPPEWEAVESGSATTQDAAQAAAMAAWHRAVRRDREMEEQMSACMPEEIEQ